LQLTVFAACGNKGSDSGVGDGVSDFFPLPTYQNSAGVLNSVNDNHQGRGVPDIAGYASGYSLGTATSSIGGTSAVAPLYVGLIALINATLGRPTGLIVQASNLNYTTTSVS
jgi:kumamolisin